MTERIMKASIEVRTLGWRDIQGSSLEELEAQVKKIFDEHPQDLVTVDWMEGEGFKDREWQKIAARVTDLENIRITKVGEGRRKKRE